MVRIETQDYWKKRKIIMGISNKKDFVAIGEEVDSGGERFIHIDIDEFLQFAEKVKEDETT